MEAPRVENSNEFEENLNANMGGVAVEDDDEDEVDDDEDDTVCASVDMPDESRDGTGH